jgi:hypothetical protein
LVCKRHIAQEKSIDINWAKTCTTTSIAREKLKREEIAKRK